MKLNGNRPDPARRRGISTGLIVLIAVAALLLAAVIAYFIWERPIDLPEETPRPAHTQVPVRTPAPDGRDAPDGTDGTDVPPDAPDESDAPGIAEVSSRRKGVYTILVLGRDQSSNSTDTIIVVSFDTAAHSISAVSIPRDTLINIGWSGTPKKINAVFPGYENSGRSGVEGMKEHIRKLLGFSVDCYAVVSLEAVEQAVDCIGGVWFDVPQDMKYDDPTQNLHIDVKQGYQLLSGADALGVLRFRHGYAGGDVERIGVQQALLKALAGQMLTLGNIPNLGELLTILSDNLDTDLTTANMAWFARQFLACKSDDVRFHTLPYATGCYINGVSYVSVDLEGWLTLVNESLNPYTDAVTAANVDILTSNYSGTRLYATTGAVAGGADSFYCLSCTVANGGTVTHHLPGTCPNGG